MSDRTPRRERRNSQNPDMRNRPPAAAERSMRFLLISSRARNKSAIYSSVRPEVKVMEYSYDSTTLEDLQADVSEALNGKKVSSIAMVLHSSEHELFICAPDESRLSRRSIVKDEKVRNFLIELINDNIDRADWSARVDFLATYMAEQIDGGLLAKELEAMLGGCQVGLSKNFEGNDIQVMRNAKGHGAGGGGAFPTVGEMYFDLPTLKNLMSQVGKVTKDGQKKLKEYDKIRKVGTGAFGSAVLYRRKKDALMCIIKEINLLELAGNDREMAMNEVKVLATMDHPNIIAFHDAFQKDGILMIEMEYADGGNLAEFLQKRKTRMEENDILVIFSQIVSAIRYMHNKNVLHRDLKTANIFLTKDMIVKIGDFGISKVLTTQQAGAHTVLGTPYYISPEMCEGKVYDEKSDIWALGCILYEMACLQKTFEGSNLPALVKKIMIGQFAPIRGNYSAPFKQLVKELLQRDPEFRPTASKIALSLLPEVMALHDDYYYEDEDPEDIEFEMAADNKSRPRQSRPPRSVLYYLKGYESSITLTPVQLPPRSRILQISVSNTHIVALTADLMVYTWGEGLKGQLGHGEVESWRSRPGCVEPLKAKSITRVGAGDGFSVFTSDTGIVMTCGDGSFGALGHGDWHSSAVPQLVQSLLAIDIAAVACGNEHVVVVGGKGDVYAWGKGAGGRLGLGHDEDCCTPQEVKIDTEDVFIVNVKCSGNATILLSDKGQLFACGGNRYNRLGLDEYRSLFMSTHIDKVLVPTRVKSIKHPIVDIAMGPTHTVALTNLGKVIAFGRNSEAQLGRGHARSVQGPEFVKALQDKEIGLVSCGATFTVVGTVENVIYFWGTRFISPVARPDTRNAFGDSFGARLATPMDLLLTEAEVRAMVQREKDSGPNGTGRNVSTGLMAHDRMMMVPMQHDDRSVATISTAELIKHQGEITMKDVVLEPQEILALYASQSQLEKGGTVMLSKIESQNQNIFLIVETTCPLSKTDRPGTGSTSAGVKPPPLSIDIGVHDNDSEEEHGYEEGRDYHDQSVPPDWIQNELNDADAMDGVGARPPTRGGNKRPQPQQQQLLKPRQQPHDKQEYEKKLDDQYRSLQIELRLQAENAVKEREKTLNEEIVRLRQELDRNRQEKRDLISTRGGAEGGGGILDKGRQRRASSSTCSIQ